MAKAKKQDELAMMDLGIKCALSGETPKPDIIVFDANEDGIPTPVGWIRVTVERVLANPNYLDVYNAKETLIGSQVAQVYAQAEAAGKTLTDEEKLDAQKLVRINFEAQFAYTLATMPRYVIAQEEAWIAPPESSKSMQKEWNDLGGKVLGVQIGVNDEGDGGKK